MRLETPRPTFCTPTLTETIGEGIGRASAAAVAPHSCGFWEGEAPLVATPRPTTVMVAGSRKQVRVPLRGRAEAEVLRERPVFLDFSVCLFIFEGLRKFRVFFSFFEQKGREREKKPKKIKKRHPAQPPSPPFF